jgi:hypothetical protein
LPDERARIFADQHAEHPQEALILASLYLSEWVPGVDAAAAEAHLGRLEARGLAMRLPGDPQRWTLSPGVCIEEPKRSEELHQPSGQQTTLRRRGRPPSASCLTSAAVNYQALAWQVSRRIEAAKQQGHKLKIKDAVREEMLLSVKWRNAHGRSTREGVVRSKIDTAYAEVRKLLKRKKWGGASDR